jgi:hypothetical protein
MKKYRPKLSTEIKRQPKYRDVKKGWKTVWGLSMTRNEINRNKTGFLGFSTPKLESRGLLYRRLKRWIKNKSMKIQT